MHGDPHSTGITVNWTEFTVEPLMREQLKADTRLNA